MKQREVTDENATTWVCVQAYSGGLGGEKTKDQAEKLTEDTDGKVPVVCTPDGGAQSIRLKLPKNWLEELNDDSLLRAISAAKD
ncbi:hypothetical protein [Pontibacter harenae]|uniref:hypothetical protein n=1 Tax=Pontibacter harenae TaxID=2894083 RepID=UPI001E3B43A9|nr:hypothetical protein [Pontibacter harenae]MCC9165484.1 hypothetical protein [Pontibacter harenae]